MLERSWLEGVAAPQLSGEWACKKVLRERVRQVMHDFASQLTPQIAAT